MPSSPDDGFVDEDEDEVEIESDMEIEIVSLLDRHNQNDNHETNATEIGRAGGEIHYNRGAKKRKQLVGVFVTICVILLLSTTLLSRSSSTSTLLLENNTLSIIASDDNIKGNTSIIVGSNTTATTSNNNSTINKHKNETSQSLPTPLPTPLPSTSKPTSKPTPTPTQKITPTPPPTIDKHGGTEDDITNWFELHTGNSRIDRAYRLAMDELHQNIREDEHGSPSFVAGAGRDQLSTRDASYAIELAGGLVQPEVSRRSLESCTEQATWFDNNSNMSRTTTIWLQDVSDHFGGWPNLSDAIVGARGAWHLYLYTGNSTFLEWAYETTLMSLLRAESDALLYNESFSDGLFGGSSSFMESNSGYPEKYKGDGELVGKTKALSTNILYYNGYFYAYKMGTILMEHNQIVKLLKDRSRALQNTIRKRLWTEKKGCYAYFEDENGKLVEKIEGLGISLAMLSGDFESDHRIQMIFDNVRRQMPSGIASLWPRFPHGSHHLSKDSNDDNVITNRYHNGRIWPFVSGYFAIATARHGEPDMFAEEMAQLIDLSEQENTFAEFYESDKSFPPHRSRQLWSDTGYLGMVYKGLFGMDFHPGSIEFSPTKVEGKQHGVLKTNETISLLNVKYRNAILDIYVTGFGTNVTSFKLNGEVQEQPKMDGYVTGRQRIEIEVAPSIH